MYLLVWVEKRRTVYFTGASVSRAVTELASRHARDHCALVRSGCAFMVHVCEDEYQLYTQFFSRETPLLE